MWDSHMITLRHCQHSTAEGGSFAYIINAHVGDTNGYVLYKAAVPCDDYKGSVSQPFSSAVPLHMVLQFELSLDVIGDASYFCLFDQVQGNIHQQESQGDKRGF